MPWCAVFQETPNLTVVPTRSLDEPIPAGASRAPRTATTTATAQTAVPTYAMSPGRSPKAAAAHSIVQGGVR